MKNLKQIVPILAFIITINCFSQVVWGHGGGTPQLTNTQAGPYWVSVWTQPDPLLVGDVHFTISVAEPPASDSTQNEAGNPVLEATVYLRFTSLTASNQSFTMQATHEDAVNKIFYEADVDISESGEWQVTVLVDGPGGPGEATFNLEVQSKSQSSWVVFWGIGIFLVITAIVAERFLKRKREVL